MRHTQSFKSLKRMMSRLKLLYVIEELPKDMMYQAYMDVEFRGTNNCDDWLEYIQIGKEASHGYEPTHT